MLMLKSHLILICNEDIRPTPLEADHILTLLSDQSPAFSTSSESIGFLRFDAPPTNRMHNPSPHINKHEQSIGNSNEPALWLSEPT